MCRSQGWRKRRMQDCRPVPVPVAASVPASTPSVQPPGVWSPLRPMYPLGTDAASATPPSLAQCRRRSIAAAHRHCSRCHLLRRYPSPHPHLLCWFGARRLKAPTNATPPGCFRCWDTPSIRQLPPIPHRGSPHPPPQLPQNNPPARPNLPLRRPPPPAPHAGSLSLGPGHQWLRHYQV